MVSALDDCVSDEDHFICGDGFTSISCVVVCDGYNDCLDRLDEHDCLSHKLFASKAKTLNINSEKGIHIYWLIFLLGSVIVILVFGIAYGVVQVMTKFKHGAVLIKQASNFQIGANNKLIMENVKATDIHDGRSVEFDLDIMNEPTELDGTTISSRGTPGELNIKNKQRLKDITCLKATHLPYVYIGDNYLEEHRVKYQLKGENQFNKYTTKVKEHPIELESEQTSVCSNDSTCTYTEDSLDLVYCKDVFISKSDSDMLVDQSSLTDACCEHATVECKDKGDYMQGMDLNLQFHNKQFESKHDFMERTSNKYAHGRTVEQCMDYLCEPSDHSKNLSPVIDVLSFDTRTKFSRILHNECISNPIIHHNANRFEPFHTSDTLLKEVA